MRACVLLGMNEIEEENLPDEAFERRLEAEKKAEVSPLLTDEAVWMSYAKHGSTLLWPAGLSWPEYLEAVLKYTDEMFKAHRKRWPR